MHLTIYHNARVYAERSEDVSVCRTVVLCADRARKELRHNGLPPPLAAHRILDEIMRGAQKELEGRGSVGVGYTVVPALAHVREAVALPDFSSPKTPILKSL